MALAVDGSMLPELKLPVLKVGDVPYNGATS